MHGEDTGPSRTLVFESLQRGRLSAMTLCTSHDVVQTYTTKRATNNVLSAERIMPVPTPVAGVVIQLQVSGLQDTMRPGTGDFTPHR